MDQFDFNAPINATIFYDDSDDEIIKEKPIIKEEKEIKKEKNFEEASSILKQETIENDGNNGSPKLLSALLKTKTSTSIKHNLENTEQQLQSRTSNDVPVLKKQKDDALHQKQLDMPYLEFDVSLDTGNINTNKHNKDETRDPGKIITSKTEKIEMLTEVKKVFQEKLTKRDSDSIKQQKAPEISPKKKTCTRNISKDIIKTKENQRTKDIVTNVINISNDINPSNDNNEVQKQDMSNDAACSKCLLSNRQGPPTTEISPIVSQNQNIDTNRAPIINIEINPLTPANDQVQSIEDKSTQSLNVFNKTVIGYLKGIIDTVSEHMIHILNAFQHCLKICQGNSDPRFIDKANYRYLMTKTHFFDLSYSAVVNVIIPRADDPTFVSNFIANTIQIGHSKSLSLTYEQIEPLYNDMIKWVKNRQRQIQNMVTSPLLVQQLQKPPKEVNSYQIEQVPKKSSGSKRKPQQSKHLYENVDESPNSHKLHQYRHPHPNVQSLNSISQNKSHKNTDQNRQCVERPAINGSYQQSPRFSELPQYTQHMADKQCYENQMSSTSMQNSVHMPNYDLQQINRVVNRLPPYPNYNIQSDTRYYNSVPSWINSAKEPAGQKQAPTWDNNILPSYSQTLENQEIILSQNYRQHLQPENTTQMEPNRSISRDSGFMSPANFNNSDLPLQEEQMTQQLSTPLITHVTSLNPNAALIQNGYCGVCGKITKQKCLGCFSCYYCSHNCQFLDWNRHQLICKEKTCT